MPSNIGLNPIIHEHISQETSRISSVSKPDIKLSDDNINSSGVKEVMIILGQGPSKWLFMPEGKVQYWELFMSLVLIASCLTIPINLAFDLEDYDASWRNYGYVVDILFTVDIFVNFNSAYET